MKKIFLTVVFVLVAVLSCTCLFACDDSTSVQKPGNGSGASNSALDNALDDFFDDGVGLYDVISGIENKVSVEVYFESDTMMGDDLSRIGFTQYADLNSNSFVLDFDAIYQNEPLSATLYGNKNGFVVSGESLFGNSSAYGLYFDTFIRNYSGSVLSEALGSDAEEALEAIELMRQVKELMSTSVASVKADTAVMLNDVIAAFDKTTVRQNVTVGSKSVVCSVDQYEITTANICDAIEIIYETIEDEIGTNSEMTDEVSEIIAELQSEADIDLTLAIASSKTDNKLVNISLYGGFVSTEYDDYYDETYETSVELELDVDFTDTQILFTAITATNNSEEVVITLSIDKKIKSNAVTYSITASIDGWQFNNQEMLNVALTFKKSGDFVFTASIYDDSNELEAEVRGTYSVGKNTASLVIESVKYQNVTIEFELGITINAAPNMPRVPSNVKDVVGLNEDKLRQLIESLRDSDFIKLINYIEDLSDSEEY